MAQVNPLQGPIVPFDGASTTGMSRRCSLRCSLRCKSIRAARRPRRTCFRSHVRGMAGTRSRGSCLPLVRLSCSTASTLGPDAQVNRSGASALKSGDVFWLVSPEDLEERLQTMHRAQRASRIPGPYPPAPLQDNANAAAEMKAISSAQPRARCGSALRTVAEACRRLEQVCMSCARKCRSRS